MRTNPAAVVAAMALSFVIAVSVAPPADAAGSARVEGIVSAPAGGLPDVPVRVMLSDSTYVEPLYSQTTYSDPVTGAYAFDAPAGTYYLRFEYLGAANILPFIWSSGSLLYPGKVVLTEGTPLVLDRALRPGASVSGVAVGAGDVALESLTVRAWDIVDAGRSTFDPATGAYTIDRIPAGSYRLEFTSTAGWKTAEIPNVALTEGQVRTGLDVVLASTTTIEGRLTYRTAPAGVYPTGVHVGLRNPLTGAGSGFAVSESDGSYRLEDIAPGEYQVCAYSSFGNAFENCYGDLPIDSAPTVTVEDGEVRSGVDIPLDPAGTIDGQILSRLSPAATEAPLETGRVVAYRLLENGYAFEASVSVSADGTYTLGPLTPGEYRLRFSDTNGVFNSEYWDDQRYFADATTVDVAVGAIVGLGPVVLETRAIEVARLSGQDRFDVVANISKTLFPPNLPLPTGGVPVIYVANGLDFPDALAAGPAAAAHGGLVLLVTPDTIPAVIRAELERLNPQRIVVAGGPASVSPAVFAQLQTFVTSPSDATRQGGSTRYDAARNIVLEAFGDDGADMAIIATGNTFPDALSAGPAAASQGGPVILVNGLATTLDAATRDLILELGIERVYIAGGTGSVHPGIETALNNLLGNANVDRFAGTDRFEVGVLLSQEFFAQADHAFIATAFNFPDALAGGPLAAAYGSPLYLARPECLPRDVGFDILDLDTQALVLLGGTASLTPAIEQFKLCST